MALISSLLPRVHDEFPIVPEVIALRALSDSAREFLTHTHVWVGNTDTMRLTAGESSYELDVDPGVQVAAVISAKYNGRDISPSTARDFRGGTGPVNGYTQRLGGLIELEGSPQTGDTLQATVAFTLRLDEVGVDLPDSLFDEYGEGLAAGAKMRLVKQAGQPWYAPDSAPIYMMQFKDAVDTALRRSISSVDQAEMRVKFNAF